MLAFLFSFNGRIRRLHWWLGRLGVIGTAIAIIVVLAALTPTSGPYSDPYGDSYYADGADSGASAVFGIAILALIVVGAWIELALTVKRWHDRDKSGWMVLIAFIPLIGPIWTLIECGFLDGTQGSNKYGASPKGIGDSDVSVFT